VLQTTRDTIRGIAGAILAAAPHRFALCGLSMGGYIVFEMMRQAPERVERLALLDTTALSDTPAPQAYSTGTIRRIQFRLRNFMAIIRPPSAARRCGVETSRIQNDA
jgi:pimeloyl-ACP methyl ester carboxylesterase